MIDIYAKNANGVWFGLAYDVENGVVFATNFAFGEERVLKSLLASIPFGVPIQRSDKPSTFAERDCFVGECL